MKCLAVVVLLSILAPAAYAGEIVQEDIKIPVAVKTLFGTSVENLAVRVYRPAPEGRHPMVLINHGKARNEWDARKMKARYAEQSKVFYSKGFIVVVPSRRGYGESGGSLAESSGKCANPNFHDPAMEAAHDIKAVVDHMKRQPYLDPGRILMTGVSVGGFASLAYASLYSSDIVGVVNFSGGHGSAGPGEVCGASRLIATIGDFGKTATVPTLWLYNEDDSYFSPQLARDMYQAYVGSGGKAKLIIFPKTGIDHHLFTKGVHLWQAPVEEFLRELRLIP